jgi:hypothetical protein
MTLCQCQCQRLGTLISDLILGLWAGSKSPRNNWLRWGCCRSSSSAPYIPSGTRKVTMSGRNRREANEVLLNKLCFSIMNPVIKSAGHFTRNKPSIFANNQQLPKGVIRFLDFSTYHNTPQLASHTTSLTLRRR